MKNPDLTLQNRIFTRKVAKLAKELPNKSGKTHGDPAAAESLLVFPRLETNPNFASFVPWRVKKIGGSRGFTTVEIIVAILLFSAATTGVLIMGKAVRDHKTASATASQQNAYATFQSQVALQGINPALVGNPLQSVVAQPATAGTVVSLGPGTSLQIVRNLQAGFEVGAVSQPLGAQRNLAGSARVDAVNYSVAPAGVQATRGAGIGFGIETTGTAPAANGIPLAPPSFNIQGDLTNVAFPINNIATLPSSNPPGTTYRFTTDGSTPTAASQQWNNNPGWTPGGLSPFPLQVTLAAFNTDPQYAPSAPITATYSMQLIVTFGRSDGRTVNVDGFTLGDLASPAVTGIVLTENVPGFLIRYTTDGSDPADSSTATVYDGPFVPPQSQFSPSVQLRVNAISTDPRIISAVPATYTLASITVPLGAPTFITDNSVPLSPGTSVVISVSGSSAAPRTTVNNGAPTMSSSSATSFPLN
jgi:type II secretory pathway pseudopilin PulG